MNTDQLDVLGPILIGNNYKGTFPAHHRALYRLFTTENKPFGVIVNTDTAKYNGQHWIAIYVDRAHKKCFVFDSFGNADYSFHPDWRLLTRHHNTDVWFNTRIVQKARNTCALHCLYFLYYIHHYKMKPTVVVRNMNDSKVKRFISTVYRNFNRNKTH